MNDSAPTPSSEATGDDVSFARRARTKEEQHYYALQAKAWRILAPFYDAMVFPLRRLRREVVKLAGVGPSDRILDVATGTGEQAIAFAEAGAEVVGVDLSPAMLRIAGRKIRGRHVAFQVADARDLPFDDACFDVCCVSFGLHEMPVGVRLDVLREMARVTKPEGKVVIVDYALPKHPIAAALVYRLVKLYERDNYAEFVRSELHAMLAGAGLITTKETRVPVGVTRFWSPAMIVVASRASAPTS